MTPTPMPTPGELTVDPSRVTPGMLGFLSLLFLIIAVVVIYFSMRKQLSRIDFDEGAMPAGVRPLPKYATKAERQKAADAARAGLGATARSATGQGATGQGATGQGATGQGATGQGATGQGATGQGATGQGATGQGATTGSSGGAGAAADGGRGAVDPGPSTG